MAPFFLLKLPFVPLKQIIKQLDLSEVSQLAMCSSNTRVIMEPINYNLHWIYVHLGDFPKIILFQNSIKNIGLIFGEEAGPVIRRRDKLCEELKCPYTEDPNQYCFNMSKSLHRVFKPKILHYLFYVDHLKKSKNVKEYITSCLMGGEYNMASLMDGSLDVDLLNHFLTTVKLESRIWITSPMPSDFKHENAFKFHSMLYEQGHWVTLDDLKTCRNVQYVGLESSNFVCDDVNQFLHYWVDSEQDMMKSLTIKLKDGVQMDYSKILDQLTHSEDDCKENLLYYIMARENEKRKLTIGMIQMEKETNTVLFQSFIPDHSYKNIPNIIKLQERKRYLYRKKLEIQKEEQSNQEELIRLIDTELESIAKELPLISRF